MLAVWEPRRSSWMSWPADVSKIRIRVPCASTNQHPHTQKTPAGRQISFAHCHRCCCAALCPFAHFVRGGGYSRALQVQSDAAQHSLVSQDVHWGLFCVRQVHYLHMAWVSPWEGQQGVVAVRTQHTETCTKDQDNSSHLWLHCRAFCASFAPTDPLGCSRSRTHAADGGCGWRWTLWSSSPGPLQSWEEKQVED